MTTPDPYHDLRATDREHLFAAAWWHADNDALPAGNDLPEVINTLTGHEPNVNTTGRALQRLTDAGLVERVDGEPVWNALGVRVTDAGYEALASGAARLDAAARTGAGTAGGVLEVNEGP